MLMPRSTLEGTILYFIEHRFLRDQFYKEPISIMSLELDDLLKIFKGVYMDNKCEFNYTKEDFDIEKCKVNDYYVQIITFPKPNEATLCDRIYFIYNDTINYKNIITIERAIEEPKGFLCSWGEDKQHNNHGEIVSLDWNEEDRAMMIAIERQIIADSFMKE